MPLVSWDSSAVQPSARCEFRNSSQPDGIIEGAAGHRSSGQNTRLSDGLERCYTFNSMDGRDGCEKLFKDIRSRATTPSGCGFSKRALVVRFGGSGIFFEEGARRRDL